MPEIVTLRTERLPLRAQNATSVAFDTVAPST
jgi:hypothetical protein